MENKNRKMTWWNWVVIALIIIAMISIIAYFVNGKNRGEVLSYDNLLKKIDNKEVAGIYFTSSYGVNVIYKATADGENGAAKFEKFKKGKYKDAVCITVFRDKLVETIEKHKQADPSIEMPVIIMNDPNSGSAFSYIMSGASLLLMIGIGVMLFLAMKGKGGAGGAMSFAKTKARVSSSVKVRFADVAGAEEEKEELKEVVDFLKAPKKYREIGARIPKGVLLVGNPGTGKTLFAKAVAGEADVPFFSISGSDFVEMFVGVGASRVRDLFQQAKRNQPCIVFIDEIDAVGRKRGAGLGGGNDEREQTLNQLLVEMDGFEGNTGIVIMAATNRPDVLDPALMRPGRFDRQIYIHMPDVKGREAIFKVHAKNKPLGPGIDFRNLARLTTGFSGADIENLLNEAAILAARDNRKIIFMKDITEGINKVIAGPQKKSRIITEKDKRITAYHEAGHALVGRFMKNADAVQEVSIIPRGMAAGYTISRPKSDDSHVTYNHLMDTIAMTLGGRAAEALVIQDITTGASQDIKQATATARAMVTEWGMSPKLKNTYFGGEEEVFIGRDYQMQTSFSDETSSVIDKEVMNIIDINYNRAYECIKEHIDVLHGMVQLLFVHETIYGDEVDKLIEGQTVEQVSEYIEQKKKDQKDYVKKEEERVAPRSPFGNPSDYIVGEKQPEITIIGKAEPDIINEKPEESATESEVEAKVQESKSSEEGDKE